MKRIFIHWLLLNASFSLSFSPLQSQAMDCFSKKTLESNLNDQHSNYLLLKRKATTLKKKPFILEFLLQEAEKNFESLYLFLRRSPQTLTQDSKRSAQKEYDELKTKLTRLEKLIKNSDQ